MKTKLFPYRIITLLAICFLIIMPTQTWAQDEEAEPKKEKKKSDKPVRNPWAAGMLIETQNDLVWAPKTLEMVMQHRFGNLNANNGFDLVGIYGAANIRIGLNYGLFKNAQIGFGTTKDKLIQDLNWKYKILTQTRSNSMPIALTYYGNIEMSAMKQENFGVEYKFSNRLSYFNQLIVSRKFTKSLSVMMALNYSHFNQIDSVAYPNLDHDNFGLVFAGRLRVSPQGSIIVEYHQPLTTPGAAYYMNRYADDPVKSKDQVGLRNLSIGYEVATSSHAFQLFLTTYRGISYQQNLVYNTNFFTDGGILIGFNITRNWNF